MIGITGTMMYLSTSPKEFKMHLTKYFVFHIYKFQINR
jgi:hypothetical protein